MAMRTDYETEEQRAAFRLYLEVRSLPKLWVLLGKGEATIKRWSTWHKWVSRAEAIAQGLPDPGPPPKEFREPTPRTLSDREKAKQARQPVPRARLEGVHGSPSSQDPLQASSQSASSHAAPGLPSPQNPTMARGSSSHTPDSRGPVYGSPSSHAAPGAASSQSLPSSQSSLHTEQMGQPELSPAEAQRVVRQGVERGLGARANDSSQEVRAIRTLWVTAVKTLLAGQCSTVRGPCPYCGGRVELQGCGQAPAFKPTASDVKNLMTLMREIEAEERAKEEEAQADKRSVDEVAHSVATQLEQLGGLGLIAGLVALLQPDAA